MTQDAASAQSDSPGLRVEVRLFAAAADLANARQLSLHVPVDCRLCGLIEQLLASHPELNALAHSSRWAVEERFVPVDFVIDRPLTIAMIPPVSGG